MRQFLGYGSGLIFALWSLQASAQLLDFGTLDGTNGFTITGSSPAQFLGLPVSNAGDFNNDGFDDVLVVASGTNPTTGSGVYVIFGGNQFDASIDLSALDGTDGTFITGGGLRSIDASGVSDVNADGVDDIIISTRIDDPSAASAFVIFGRQNPPATIDVTTLNGFDGFAMTGARQIATVVSTGDLNGDGIGDMLVASVGDTDDRLFTGTEPVVVFGRSLFDPVVDITALDGTNGFAIDRVTEGGGTRGGVSAAGDFNNDGVDDLLIGRQFADPNNRSNAGEVIILFGTANFDATVDLNALDDGAAVWIIGGSPGDELGRSVSDAGDVNNDGIDDIVVGALGVDVNGNLNAGAAYVLFGQSNSVETIDLADFASSNNMAAGFAIYGSTANDGISLELSGAGDVNGDERDDIFLGSPSADAISVEPRAPGEAYIVFGRDQGNLSTRELDGGNGFAMVGQQMSLFAASLSGAGDINSDGFSDLVVSNFTASNGAGLVYVLLGDDEIGRRDGNDGTDGDGKDKDGNNATALTLEINPGDFVTSGQRLTIDYVITNIGENTASNIRLTNSLTDNVCVTSISRDFQAVCTEVYITTDEDVNAGEISVVAEVGDIAKTITIPLQTISNELSLKVVTVPSTFTSVNDIITINYQVTNQTDRVLEQVSVVDPLVGGLVCDQINLSPTYTVTCTQVYTVTQDDVDLGRIESIAKARSEATGEQQSMVLILPMSR